MPANPKKNMDDGVEETTRRVGGRSAPTMVAPSMVAMPLSGAPAFGLSSSCRGPACRSPLVGGFAAASYEAAQESHYENKQRGNQIQQQRNASSERMLKSKKMASNKSKPSNAHSPHHDDPLLRLCVLQKSDGGFLFDENLALALRLSMTEMKLLINKVESHQLVSTKGGLAVFATALAVVAMRIKFASSKDIWELQERKALDYLALHGVSETELCGVEKFLP